MRYLIIFVFTFLLINPVFADAEKVAQKVVEEKPVEEYSEDDFEVIKKKRLKRIRKELVIIRGEINELKKKESDDLDMLARIQLESKIQKLEKEYSSKRNFFIQTITSVNLNDGDGKKKRTSFSEDIKQILDPALSTFKKISERPRKMQELTDELTRLQDQYDDAELAHERLKEFQKNSKDKLLKWKLIEAVKITENLSKELKVRLEDLRFKILKMENSEQSIVSTFSGIIFDFIKTKGKNLILSLFVFILFFWLFKLGQTKFIDLVLFRLSRSDNKEVYTWIIRPTKVIYNVVTTFIAFFLSILTLYVLNDWLLVTIVLIVFAALIWSSKQYIPLFLEQSKIVLNLGSVREGERVIFNGLPWKIDSLGYYCKLENPALEGASLRVNTKELINAHSRRARHGEPWFPTRIGDWVQVSDKYGEVIMQSPEQVIIRTIGGEKVYYDAKNFLSMDPMNHSHGFSVEFSFGLDYGIQGTIIEEVLPIIQSELVANFYNEFADIKENFVNLDISFQMANASSLDLRVFLKCKGEIASMRETLNRSLQKNLVQICNKHNYAIPFDQLTVHLPHERQ